jgi:hypothetical protein
VHFTSTFESIFILHLLATIVLCHKDQMNLVSFFSLYFSQKYKFEILRNGWFPFFNYAFSQGPLVFDQLSTFISYVCHESPFKFSFLVVLIKIKINEGIVEKQEGQYLGLFLISITYTF